MAMPTEKQMEELLQRRARADQLIARIRPVLAGNSLGDVLVATRFILLEALFALCDDDAAAIRDGVRAFAEDAECAVAMLEKSKAVTQ